MQKNVQLAVRVDSRTKRNFNKKAAKIGEVSEVHRELINAFIEGRLTITPPPTIKLEKLYVGE